MGLDPEDNVSLLKSCIVGREPLLTPAEDDELALVFLADIIEELPEVLDEATIMCVIWIILGEFCVAA